MAKKKKAKKKSSTRRKTSRKAARKPAKSGARKAVRKSRKKSRRTVLRSSKGKKLYAVRTAGGQFKDIQSYARAHAMDIKRNAAAEE